MLKTIAASTNNSPQAFQVFGPPGIEAICQVLGGHDEFFNIDEILADETGKFQKLRCIWAGMFGSFLRNLALSYGCHAGIYLHGEIPSGFLGRGRRDEHIAFREKFEMRGPTRGYLRDIPTYTLNDPDIFIIGLNRIISNR